MASTIFNQSTPDLVKMYMTARSRMKGICLFCDNSWSKFRTLIRTRQILAGYKYIDYGIKKIEKEKLIVDRV